MARTAVIVTDVLHAYDFEDAGRLAESAEKALEPASKLIRRARETEGVELIYVNDNHHDWNSSQEDLVKNALEGERPDLVEPLVPPDDAAFVLKARHTIFYGTPLDYLLWERDVSRLVLVGQVTEQCILYSALDAHIRHYDVSVARDGVAHIHEELAEAALKMMETNMGAELVACEDVDLTGEEQDD